MKTSHKLLFSVLTISLGFTACKKDDPNLISSENNQIADATFSHIGDVVEEEVKYLEKEHLSTTEELTEETVSTHDSIAEISFSLSPNQDYIDTITIDYGTDGVEWRGRVRTGKILITQNGKRSDIGTVTKAELIDFTIDDYAVEGTKTLERSAYEFSQGNFNATDLVTVRGGKITSPSGNETFLWESDRTHKFGWINGEVAVLIEGNINGVNTQGTSFTITTGKPLKFIASCPRIVEGELRLTPAGMDTRTLDYGNGACDAAATVTINKKDYEITLW